jgi:hypothetical protein
MKIVAVLCLVMSACCEEGSWTEEDAGRVDAARLPPADASQDAPVDAGAPSDADPYPNCGAVGEPCCTADPLFPCDHGLTCGVPPQDHCTPVFGS